MASTAVLTAYSEHSFDGNAKANSDFVVSHFITNVGVQVVLFVSDPSSSSSFKSVKQ